jgi:hypothetical protein
MRSVVSALALIAFFLVGGELQGQEASASDLEQELRELAAGPNSLDQDRQVVLDFLDRDEVGEAAAGHGIDLDRLRARVDALDGNLIATLARQAERTSNDADMVGGNTIVISTSTLIIILLILILVT